MILLKNIKCFVIDKDFFYIDKCDYYLNENNIEEFHAIVKLLKGPLTNCLFQLEFEIKTFSVPLKFNGTYDACKFLEQRKKFRVLKRIYDVFAKYTNINHTCPLEVS